MFIPGFPNFLTLFLKHNQHPIIIIIKVLKFLNIKLLLLLIVDYVMMKI